MDAHNTTIYFHSPLFICSSGLQVENLDSSVPSEQGPEISFWERLGKAAMLDIESSEFSWCSLSSLHHVEHGSSTEHSEDEINRAVEVFDIVYSYLAFGRKHF